MAALAIVPASGSITATESVCKVTVTAADTNTLTGYNVNSYPQKPEIRYYIEATATGEDALRSYVFNVASDGTHIYNSLIFPAGGSWTVDLRDAADDSQVATLAVTVS